MLGVEVVVVVACGLRGLARSFVEVGRRPVPERSRASDRTGVHARDQEVIEEESTVVADVIVVMRRRHTGKCPLHFVVSILL